MVEKQTPAGAPVAGLRETIEVWGASNRRGLLAALIPGGRPEDREYFSGFSDRFGLVIWRDGHGWSYSPDDPSKNPDSKFATGDTLASLAAILYEVPIEDVAAVVGAVVLGLDVACGPGTVTWHWSHTEDVRKILARCDDKDDDGTDGDDGADNNDPGDAAEPGRVGG